MASQPFRRLKETLEETEYFLRAAVRNFHEVGTVFPTSKWVAKTMCKPLFQALNRGEHPTVIEIGAGTGSVTRFLYGVADKLSRLVICECNPFYCRYLRELLRKEYSNQADRVQFFDGKIQDFNSTSKFDFIISTIPLLCMDRPQILQIFKKLNDISHENTVMTHVEHVGARQFKLAFQKELRDIYREIKRSQICDEIVYRNYLPMRVITLKPAKIRF